MKQSLCLDCGPQPVEVEARGPIGDHVGAELRDDGGWPGGGGRDEGSWNHLGTLLKAELTELDASDGAWAWGEKRGGLM